MNSINGIGLFCRRAAAAEEGAALIEFAIALPLLLLIMVAFAEFGTIAFMRLRLEEIVSMTSNYAIMNYDRLHDIGEEAFADELIALLGSGDLHEAAELRVDINRAAVVSVEKGSEAVHLHPANMQNCYCPTRTSDFLLGPQTECGSSCPGGGTASRFIVIEASKHYEPLFPAYGLSRNGAVSAKAIVPILQ